MTIVETIEQIFAVAGCAAYFGEAVSQTEHVLQTAHLAKSAGAADELIVAALLHDIGHLLRGLSEDAAIYRVDDTHEAIGAEWLERHFRLAVSVPVRLHVPVKRYLCAIDSGYRASLSSASQLSLKLQGGPMSSEQVEFFERGPYFASAVSLRRWDDSAKIPGLDVPGLENYRSTLLAVLNRGVTSRQM
jgi:phosphonate degradation associated HDIG domain protein